MGGTQEDLLIETATRIFAELGFDGASLQLIADAAGLDIAAVHRTAGTKADLYRTVMRRADEAERAAMDAALTRFTPTRDGVVLMADAYFDFHLSHPQVLALWQHRWMGDAQDVPGMEDLYTKPMSVQLAGLVRELFPPDVDADHLVWSVVWCVYGFLTGGIVYTGEGESPRRHAPSVVPYDDEAIRRFRAFLHTMLDHLLTPLPEPPS